MTGTDINAFLKYCSITASNSTLRKIENRLIYINSYFKGKLANLKLVDIHGFLAVLNKSSYSLATKNDTIKVLKRFLKWKYKDWNIRFNSLSDAKTYSKDQRKLSKNDLLSVDEMNLILNSVDSLKYKALLVLLQETAGRPEELLKLKWRDINFNSKEVRLHSSKTNETRTIPIKHSINHLKRYRLECFSSYPRDSHIIFNFSNQAFQHYLNKVEHELNFKKHLYPYLWRHSVLTRMIKTLSPKVYEMYAGHKLETGMRIYAHLDNEDLRYELDSKIYKFEEINDSDKRKIQELEKRLQKQELALKKALPYLQKIKIDLLRRQREKF